MTNHSSRFRYPRRRIIRTFLRRVIDVAFFGLTDFHVTGQENLPPGGPLIVVANHFSFVDPVAVVRIAPWPIEFLGGFTLPNAPPSVTWLPKAWGYYPVLRGTGSRYALKAAESILKQNGVLSIFPEAGSWATVLRPARPGTAFIAARTGAPLLPIGLEGMPRIVPSLRRGKRTVVTVRIGKPFGPFEAPGKGRERRERLDEVGHEIMRRIAELIPPEKRGYYSDDPAIREAARGTEIYPWTSMPETT